MLSIEKISSPPQMQHTFAFNVITTIFTLNMIEEFVTVLPTFQSSQESTVKLYAPLNDEKTPTLRG